MILFTIAVLGYGIGNIKVAGLKLGTSAVLLVALVFGHFGFEVPALIREFGLICFVTSVGFIAGPIFFRNFRGRAFSYLILGTAIILIGAALTAGIIGIFGLPTPLAVGMFTGALTSTPGLAAAIEATGDSLASVGYGIAYPFGVVGVVLFIQLLPKLLHADIPAERAKISAADIVSTRQIRIRGWHACVGKKLGQLPLPDVRLETSREEELRPGMTVSLTGTDQALDAAEKTLAGGYRSFDDNGFFTFAVAVVLGLLLASVSIPLPGGVRFSLGTSGGPLITGLILGHFRKLGQFAVEIPSSTLETIRELGLMLFLMGAGTNAGKGFVEVLKTYGLGLFFLGALITLAPMVIGYWIARRMLHMELLNTLGSICGGMTSTPALGTLITVTKSTEVAASYAATYPIALIFVVLCSQIISKFI